MKTYRSNLDIIYRATAEHTTIKNDNQLCHEYYTSMTRKLNLRVIEGIPYVPCPGNRTDIKSSPPWVQRNSYPKCVNMIFGILSHLFSLHDHIKHQEFATMSVSASYQLYFNITLLFSTFSGWFITCYTPSQWVFSSWTLLGRIGKI